MAISGSCVDVATFRRTKMTPVTVSEPSIDQIIALLGAEIVREEGTESETLRAVLALAVEEFVSAGMPSRPKGRSAKG